MFSFTEGIAEYVERFRYYTKAQWLLRGLLVVSGLIAALPLWIMLPSPFLGVVALLGLLVAALLPRGHVATAFIVVMAFWASLAGDIGVVGLIPVALGCLGVHSASAASAVGPSFAEVDPAVWRRFVVPVVIGAAAVPVAVVLAALSGLVTLPSSLILVALVIGVVLAAGVVALWPARPPQDSQ